MKKEESEIGRAMKEESEVRAINQDKGRNEEKTDHQEEESS